MSGSQLSELSQKDLILMKLKAAVNLCTELNAVNCVPVRNAKWQRGTVLIYLSKINNDTKAYATLRCLF